MLKLRPSIAGYRAEWAVLVWLATALGGLGP